MSSVDGWLYVWCYNFLGVFFFKQKTAYEMRISDWSSDVCSSDLLLPSLLAKTRAMSCTALSERHQSCIAGDRPRNAAAMSANSVSPPTSGTSIARRIDPSDGSARQVTSECQKFSRSEEHTSELQSLMRISYAVFCLKKQNTKNNNNNTHPT